ncbi:MAG: transcription factor IIB [Nitrososphaerota archaeon]|jgi:transcription initiation factor TFIIB|nr:transcription factor IIB [Nitrososphaerota archaeon]MDG6937638.1 transcription factor IIB [Nitrososphaerota archaeon]MDG6962036.1 transcription factor IIB [Nitrososphaerota archaeon]MDG6969873.1 transcription factor IIB [Nitrososphaerota archaeon]MDG6972949.1 transcription factor IIB [Nitrososphaerota archaeon]
MSIWGASRDEGFRNSCPVCGNRLIGDSEKGEQVCPTCGYVTLAPADSGPEWKAMDLEDKNKRVRVGAPTTLALHDFGLTTEIGRTMRDSHGKYLDPTMRATVEKMRKWQSRSRTINSEERGLSNVLSKISELCDALNLPDNVAETAAQIYRTSAKKKVAKSKSILGMTAATVYLACRKCGVSRTLKEVARASGMEKGSVARYFRLVLKEVEKEYVPPPSVEKYISKLVNIAKIDARVERLALTLSRKTSDSRISSGKAPAGLAAAYVYLSSVMVGEHLPQREVAEFAEVTEVTVRNRCREILDNYVIRQEFMQSK